MHSISPHTRHWLALLIISAPLLLSTAANAQDQEGAPQTEDAEQPAEDQIPWDTNCSQATRQDEPNCVMSQMVIVPQSRQVLLRMEIEVPGDRSGRRMVLQLPHGMYLPAGLTLGIDGETWQETDVQTCDGNGCYAVLELDDEGLRRLQEGAQMTVTFQQLSRQPVNVPVDLNGFSEAYAKIR